MLMPPAIHNTDASVGIRSSFLAADTWETEVVPRLPDSLYEKARDFRAFQRVRVIASPNELLRAVLAYTLCGLSMRRLGCWAGLIGVGDVSEAA